MQFWILDYSGLHELGHKDLEQCVVLTAIVLCVSIPQLDFSFLIVTSGTCMPARK